MSLLKRNIGCICLKYFLIYSSFSKYNFVRANSFQSCQTLRDPVDCTPVGSSVHRDCPGKNTGVGCHALIQVIFPTQGSNLHLPHWQVGSLLLETPGKPRWNITSLVYNSRFIFGFFQAFLIRIHLQCRRPWFNSWVRKIHWRRDRLPTSELLAFPCGSAGKESTCNGGRAGFNPWVGKITWRRERLPIPVFWPEEFHGLHSPWGCKELDMTEQLELTHSLKHFKGIPLISVFYACIKNLDASLNIFICGPIVFYFWLFLCILFTIFLQLYYRKIY